MVLKETFMSTVLKKSSGIIVSLKILECEKEKFLNEMFTKI